MSAAPQPGALPPRPAGHDCGAVSDPRSGPVTVVVASGLVDCPNAMYTARTYVADPRAGRGLMAVMGWTCRGIAARGDAACDDGRGNAFRIGG